MRSERNPFGISTKSLKCRQEEGDKAFALTLKLSEVNLLSEGKLTE